MENGKLKMENGKIDERKLVEFIKRNGKKSRRELMRLTGVGESTIYRFIRAHRLWDYVERYQHDAPCGKVMSAEREMEIVEAIKKHGKGKKYLLQRIARTAIPTINRLVRKYDLYEYYDSARRPKKEMTCMEWYVLPGWTTRCQKPNHYNYHAPQREVVSVPAQVDNAILRGGNL